MDVAAVTHQLVPQTAQFSNHDRAMKDLECGGKAGERPPKRPSGCICRALQVVMMDMK